MFLYRINSTGEFVPTKPTGKADLFEKVEIPANGNRVAMCDYLNGLVIKPAVEEPELVEEVPQYAHRGDNCPKCKLNLRQASAQAERYVQSCNAEAKENWIAEEADLHMVNRLLGAVLTRLEDLRRVEIGEPIPIRTRLRPGGIGPGTSQKIREGQLIA